MRFNTAASRKLRQQVQWTEGLKDILLHTLCLAGVGQEANTRGLFLQPSRGTQKSLLKLQRSKCKQEKKVR